MRAGVLGMGAREPRDRREAHRAAPIEALRSAGPGNIDGKILIDIAMFNVAVVR